MILISFMAFGQTEETTSFQTTEQSVSQLTPDSASLVTRDANKYIANGEIMNKKAFMGFLKSRDAIAYKQFRTGYNLSLAGWVLLACGIPIMATGYVMTKEYMLEEALTLGYIGNKGKIYAAFFTTILSCAATVSGIVCLGVGYARMHNTVNTYNASITNRKPVVTFNLQSSRDGLGIAMRF